MIFGAAACIENDAFENFEKAIGTHDEPGFFEHFALERLLNFFARLNKAAGQRPISLKRIAASLDKKNRITAEYEGADAGQRVLRIAPRHGYLI